LVAAEPGTPLLYRKLAVPESLLTTEKGVTFGGDVRVGDLTGDGRCDLVVFRNARGGTKPCFLGAFTIDGKVLWQVGSGGDVPMRPGPVAVHDFDGDGRTEVVCLLTDPESEHPHDMRDASIQVRDGRTGRLERQSAPEALTQRRPGKNMADWCHQRLLIANLRGTDAPRDFVVKMGEKVLAFDENLELLWSYTVKWTVYGRHTAYIPAVGDIDADGRDEVTGGCYLLDDDGTPLWERLLGPHMDSVAITEWDGGQIRAVGSGAGHVMDAEGNAVLSLGPEAVPHGQEVRVADFLAESEGPEMVLRYKGHGPDVMLVNSTGEIVKRFKLNDFPPKNIGMEAVYWHGPERPALLYNGGKLWHATGELLADLPEFPGVSFWSFCIPANVCGDDREEMLVYNPADRLIFIYTPLPLDEAAFDGYRAGPRQYNVRLMD
jgi:hypothetical protein